MKTFIKIYLKNLYIFTFILSMISISACDKPKDSAMNRLMMAQAYLKNYSEYAQAVHSRKKDSYKLYKEVFLHNRAVMTYKDIAAMYNLGVSFEKNKDFLKKIKTVYEQERKIASK